MKPRVVIFSDIKGWHEKQLREALIKYSVDVSTISLLDCVFAPNDDSKKISISGLGDALPDAVVVRGIAAGSFEQVTLRLSFLHALQELGVAVYNTARAIERTVDKSMTSFLLSQAGVPTPQVWVCESVDRVRQVFGQRKNDDLKLVVKPLFGNCGKGLKLINDITELNDIPAMNGVYYLQEFVSQRENHCRDWRALVAGDRAISAMERQSDGWITNRARGANCLPAKLDDDMASIAVAAVKATGACYAGVDVIRDSRDQLTVLEVNSIPAWKGLQQVSDVNIADMLVADLMTRIGQTPLQLVS